MSKPLPEESNLVAIGAWNPAIIQPVWLRRQFPEIITEENVAVQVVSNGAVSSLRMEFTKFFLDPSGGRLIFIPKDFEDATLKVVSDLASGINDRLSHTPVSAAGCNFAFQLEKGETFTLDDVEREESIQKLYHGLSSECTLVGRGVRHTFSGADCTVNVSYDYSDMGKIIRINFDYQHKPSMTPLKTAAEKFINNFHGAVDIRDSLVRKI